MDAHKLFISNQCIHIDVRNLTLYLHLRNRLEKLPAIAKQEADSSLDEAIPDSPQYNDVEAKFQEKPGSFQYPQVLESSSKSY